MEKNEFKNLIYKNKKRIMKKELENIIVRCNSKDVMLLNCDMGEGNLFDIDGRYKVVQFIVDEERDEPEIILVSEYIDNMIKK